MSTSTTSTSTIIFPNSSTSSNIYITGGGAGTGAFNPVGISTSNTIDPSYWDIISNPLSNLNFTIDFDFNGKDFAKRLLTDNIRGIRKNKFIFKCELVNNRMQPYELIMKMIEKNEQFSVKINITDIMTICYTNFRFTEIENNFNFGSKKATSGSSGNVGCDFSKLKVKFKYDSVSYQNHKLSTKQLRTEKIKKITENNEGSNS